MKLYKIKKGNTSPPLRGSLVDADGAPIPIDVNSTIVFNMKPRVAGGTVIAGGAVTVIDYATADVQYEWQPGDTDKPGWYEGEFTVVYGDGSEESSPNDENIPIQILSDLD